MSGKTDHSSNPDGSYFKKIPDFDEFDERLFSRENLISGLHDRHSKNNSKSLQNTLHIFGKGAANI